jgi:hypothetical protein
MLPVARALDLNRYVQVGGTRKTGDRVGDQLLNVFSHVGPGLLRIKDRAF